MNNVQEIAVASKRIYCLAFGAEDLMLDLKIEASDDEQELLFFRSQLVLASKVAGLEAPIDSVYINFKDSRGLKRASENGNKLGFQGKLLIHPNQIEIVNQAFAPTPEQILKAREIVEKYDAVGEMEREVIQVDGK